MIVLQAEGATLVQGKQDFVSVKWLTLLEINVFLIL